MSIKSERIGFRLECMTLGAPKLGAAVPHLLLALNGWTSFVFFGPLPLEFFPGQPDEVVVLGLAVLINGVVELLVIAAPTPFYDAYP